MHKNVNNLIAIENLLKKKTYCEKIPKIIAVSKTFASLDIIPLIKYGQIDFGENKIQEALDKWTLMKKEFPNIKLHMIGKLQTNKVKFLLPLFDYFHALDNLKLAKKIAEQEKKSQKKLKIFIQINLKNEDQKNGVDINYLKEFYLICVKELNLDIVGLMCLPPNDENTNIYFSEVQKLNKELNLPELSLGMSQDYLNAIKYGSTFLRIGSKIFGNRI
jgi:pyridoxal phosphate enzyme (YggS family)|tara:strand:- start:1592 stop:2245 length:654 start_codon:yes stop_codon:yes gene_type:complete